MQDKTYSYVTERMVIKDNLPPSYTFQQVSKHFENHYSLKSSIVIDHLLPFFYDYQGFPYLPFQPIGTVYKAVDMMSHVFDNSKIGDYEYHPDLEELQADKDLFKVLKEMCMYVRPFPEQYVKHIDRFIRNCSKDRMDKITFVAIKRVVRTSSPAKIMDELKYLQRLNGKHFVLPVLDVLRSKEQVSIVLPYFPSHDIRDYMRFMEISDIKILMRQLLESLAHLHRNKVMHRDIKPTNFIFSFTKKRGVLVDFGLAENISDAVGPIPTKPDPIVLNNLPAHMQEVINNKAKYPLGHFKRSDRRDTFKASRAGTRGFRAPEVLFRFPYQTGAIDVWSAGIMLLTLFSQRFPFFIANDDHDALVELCYIFGVQNMQRAAHLYGRGFSCEIPDIATSNFGGDLIKVVNLLNPNFAEKIPPEGFDLLYRCLELDMYKRITAEEALEHPFLANM